MRPGLAPIESVEQGVRDVFAVDRPWMDPWAGTLQDWLRVRQAGHLPGPIIGSSCLQNEGVSLVQQLPLGEDNSWEVSVSIPHSQQLGE